jgi:hypothetical protein
VNEAELLAHQEAVLLLEFSHSALRLVCGVVDQPGLTLAMRLIERALESEHAAIAAAGNGAAS